MLEDLQDFFGFRSFEQGQVARAIVFAESAGMRLHIAHESSADALPHIAAAKARGLDITVETCPQ
jgi:allantoinase